jgi:chemotaxis protein CheY-P-specific phosphatase CheC
MAANQKEIVEEVFCDVIGKLAFMFGEVTPKEDLPRKGSTTYVRTSMSFSGGLAGDLALAVPEEACPEIAANALGMEPDNDRVMERGLDALKEVLNVACGRILTALAGEEAMFDMSIPVISKLDATAWSALVDDPDSFGFLADDHPVLLTLSLEEDNGGGSSGS